MPAGRNETERRERWQVGDTGCDEWLIEAAVSF